MGKFNYKSDYKKFKTGDNVKITFIDNKKEVSKKVRILSINSKQISFEDKENIYECMASEIINIKKPLFILFLKKLLIVFIVLYACVVGIRILNYQEYKDACIEKYLNLQPVCFDGCFGSYKAEFNVFTGCSIEWYDYELTVDEPGWDNF